MSLFKNLFKTASTPIATQTESRTLSSCNNVTYNTVKRSIDVVENSLRMIELVQEPGIAKEIFEMQYGHLHKIYGIFSTDKYPCELLSYSARTFEKVFAKIEKLLLEYMKEDKIKLLLRVHEKDRQSTIDKIKDSLLTTHQYTHLRSRERYHFSLHYQTCIL